MAANTSSLHDQKRDALARKLAENAHIWTVVTLKQPFGAFDVGTVFWAVPSSAPDVAYLANEKACQCADYVKAQNICKHVRAVRLANERARAAAFAPSKRLEDLYGDDLEGSF